MTIKNQDISHYDRHRVSCKIVFLNLDKTKVLLTKYDNGTYGLPGGPLFNECGVIGIISSKSDTRELADYGLVSEEGISFAISAKSVSQRLTLPID